jgi:hypothetical protein
VKETQEFDDLIAEARSQARQAGLKRTDVRDAIRKARGRKSAAQGLNIRASRTAM